jgi:hypothetical protein
MAYSAYTDVQAALKQLTISATATKPTQAEVTAYIILIDAEMDATMAGAGILTPVTASSKTSYLKKVSVDGTSAMVLRSLDRELELAAQFEKSYRDALKMIMENPGSIELTTATNGYITGPDNTAERHFTREGVDW